MKIDNKIIEYASDALLDVEIVDRDKKTYKKEFNGYISSLGAAIIQSGLLPAMIFFENQDSGAEEKRYKLIDAIKIIINKKNGTYKINNDRISKYIIDNNSDNDLLNDLLNEVINAATALKLALRMYKKVD